MMRAAAFSVFKAVKYVTLTINEHHTLWESIHFKNCKNFRHSRTQK